jgi:hypothetical protein
MTDAEKEARDIARQIIAIASPGGVGYAPDWRLKIWGDRILRFAREYGPEIAGIEPDANSGHGPVAGCGHHASRLAH